MGARHGTRAGSSPVNAAACRDVAFDTVIMVKQTPRRMLAAVQEVCGGSVIVPDETAREAAKVYVRVAAGQARRETQWKATEQWGGDWSEEQREAVQNATPSNARGRRSPASGDGWTKKSGATTGPYRRAAGSAQADLLAQEIAAEAFLDDETPGGPHRRRSVGARAGATGRSRDRRERQHGPSPERVAQAVGGTRTGSGAVQGRGPAVREDGGRDRHRPALRRG